MIELLKNTIEHFKSHFHSWQEVYWSILEVPVLDPEWVDEVVPLHPVVVAGVGVAVAQAIRVSLKQRSTV